MYVPPVALILGSAFLHALWNAILKREAHDDAAASAVLSVATISALAFSLFESQQAFPDRGALLFAVLAGVAEAGYFRCLGRALAHSPLGFAYPMARGGSVLLVWPASALLFQERFGLFQAGGSVVLFAGLGLVGGIVRPSKKSAFWIFGAALSIAVYHLGYKFALEHRAAPLALFATSLGVALLTNLFAVRGGRAIAAAVRSRPMAITSAGVLCTVSFLLFLVALAHEGAGLVLTLRNTSVVFAQMFAYLLGERPTRLQLFGSALIAGGSALVAAH